MWSGLKVATTRCVPSAAHVLVGERVEGLWKQPDRTSNASPRPLTHECPTLQMRVPHWHASSGLDLIALKYSSFWFFMPYCVARKVYVHSVWSMSGKLLGCHSTCCMPKWRCACQGCIRHLACAADTKQANWEEKKAGVGSQVSFVYSPLFPPSIPL